MNNGDEGRQELSAVLAATLSTQALVSWCVLALAAVAPMVAESVGLPAIVIGYQITIVYAVGATVSLFAGSFVARLGGCRVSQVALLSCGAGCLVATLPGAATIVVASIVIGFAHGLTNPSSAQLLARRTHAGNRGLIFSIKQTGVPVGGIAAGLITPAIAVVWGWQAALLAIFPITIALAAALVPPRERWDRDRVAGTPVGLGALRGSGRALALPGLRWLCLCAICFGGIQLTLMTFVVVFAVFELGFSVLLGGALLATIQAAGVIGRIGWGIVADRLQRNWLVLAFIGMLTAAAALGFGGMGPDTPHWLVFSVAAVFGLSAVGWNGVFVSEIVRVSPPDMVGTAIGLGTFAAFAGVLIAPPAFIGLFGWLDSYSLSYAFLAIPAIVGTMAISVVGAGDRAP